MISANDKVVLLSTLLFDNANIKQIKKDDDTLILISHLNQDMKGFASITYDSHYEQFQLNVSDKQKFDYYFNKLLKSSVEWSQSERVSFIISQLLMSRAFVKTSYFSEILYISQRQVSTDLQLVRSYLDQFNLSIVSSPYKGMKILGNEKDKRACLSSLSGNSRLIIMSIADENDIKNQIDNLTTIEKIARKALDRYNIQLSEYVYDSFIIHIYVSVMRIKNGFDMEEDMENIVFSKEEHKATNEIVDKLSKKFNVVFSGYEQNYIAAHIKGKRKYSENNYSIQPEVNELVMNYLDYIDKNNQTNLKNDFKLCMNLCLHFQAMISRIRYSIKQKNPLLDEIKRRFIYEFELASEGAKIINEKYDCRLSDDEIGYIAIEIRASLEKMNEGSKSRILLICSTGRGSAELMNIKFISSFESYISKLDVCASNDVDKYDLDLYDYVFSTVPLFVETRTPVIRVTSFLDDADIYRIKKIFRSDRNKSKVHKYFSEELIIKNLEAKNKEDAIRKIIEYMKKYKEVPDRFYESILSREKLYSTSLGNQVAFPHPLEPILAETFVVFATLKTPVEWGNGKVKLIALTSIENTEHRSLQCFYDMIATIIGKEENVNRFVADPSIRTIEEIVFKTT